MQARVRSTNVARPKPEPAGRRYLTGIDKRPVAAIEVFEPGPVYGDGPGVVGDHVGDVQHHGGAQKAVYAYAREELDWWQEQLGAELPYGVFGENLRTIGLDVNAARVGEVWRIGDTVLGAVTHPRRPCQTFARWLAEQGIVSERGWVRRFGEERRLGPYLRVLRTGRVQAGDPIEVVEVPAGAPGLLDGWEPRD